MSWGDDMREIKNKTELMLRVESEIEDTLEECLRFLYVDNDLSIADISEMLNISYVTTHRWLQRANITSRSLNLLK